MRRYSGPGVRSLAAAAITPQVRDVLDIGCGAGNYTIKLLEHRPGLNCTLLDLSRPMLDRAAERVAQATTGTITTVQADVRDVKLPAGNFDVILAAAVLHHLRTDEEWESVFGSFFRWLRPGGSVWIFDLVESPLPTVQALMWQRYSDYLTDFQGDAYRDHVFESIAKEDTPRSLGYQWSLMQRVGFANVEVFHKHLCFAAFGAVKP